MNGTGLSQGEGVETAESVGRGWEKGEEMWCGWGLRRREHQYNVVLHVEAR